MKPQPSTKTIIVTQARMSEKRWIEFYTTSKDALEMVREFGTVRREGCPNEWQLKVSPRYTDEYEALVAYLSNYQSDSPTPVPIKNNSPVVVIGEAHSGSPYLRFIATPEGLEYAKEFGIVEKDSNIMEPGHYRLRVSPAYTVAEVWEYLSSFSSKTSPRPFREGGVW